MSAVYEHILAIICGDTGLFDPCCPRLSFLVYIVSCVEKNTVTFSRRRIPNIESLSPVACQQRHL